MTKSASLLLPSILESECSTVKTDLGKCLIESLCAQLLLLKLGFRHYYIVKTAKEIFGDHIHRRETESFSAMGIYFEALLARLSEVYDRAKRIPGFMADIPEANKKSKVSSSTMALSKDSPYWDINCELEQFYEGALEHELILNCLGIDVRYFMNICANRLQQHIHPDAKPKETAPSFPFENSLRVEITTARYLRSLTSWVDAMVPHIENWIRRVEEKLFDNWGLRTYLAHEGASGEMILSTSNFTKFNNVKSYETFPEFIIAKPDTGETGWACDLVKNIVDYILTEVSTPDDNTPMIGFSDLMLSTCGMSSSTQYKAL